MLLTFQLAACNDYMKIRVAMMKKQVLLAILLVMSQFLMAQEESASLMEGNGKIYVVMATVLATFLGILLFLIIIERRVASLERQIKE